MSPQHPTREADPDADFERKYFQGPTDTERAEFIRQQYGIIDESEYRFRLDQRDRFDERNIGGAEE